MLKAPGADKPDMGMPPMGPEPMGGPDPMMGMGPDPMGGGAPGGPGMDEPMPDSPDMGDDMGAEGGASDNSPKKTIQQLAGELSQELSQYNDGQDTPDTELNKYVMNMLATQAGKALTPKDKRKVIKKLEGTDEDLEDMPDGGMDAPDGAPDGNAGMNESKLNRIIDEVLNSAMVPRKKEDRRKEEISNKGVTYDNPFVSNR